MELAIVSGKASYAEPGVYGICAECGEVALPRRKAHSEGYHWYHKNAGGCSLAYLKKTVSLSKEPSRKPDKPLTKISVLGNKEHYVQKRLYLNFKALDIALKSRGDVELIPEWFALFKELDIPQASIAGKWGALKSKLITRFGIKKESLNHYDVNAKKPIGL